MVSRTTAKRATACINVIKNELKNKGLNPKTIILKLNDGELSIPPVQLSSAYYCMSVLKGKLNEAGIKSKTISQEAGEPVKPWLDNGVMPHDWFMEVCRMTGIKVNEVFEQASLDMKEVKSTGGELESIPAPVIPSSKELSEWFKTGTMPFVWFLILTKFAGLRAREVFNIVKDNAKPNNAPSPNVSSDARKDTEENEPWASTTIKDTSAKVTVPIEGALPKDPWEENPQEESVTTPVGDDELDGWDNNPKAEGPANSRAVMNDNSTVTTPPEATDNNDSKVQREIAPGVTEVDLSEPMAEPYEFNPEGGLAGMDPASQVILNWNHFKKAAIESHDGGAGEAAVKHYPTPVKLTNKIIGLKFDSPKTRTAFVDKGYMRDLQLVIDKEPLNVTLQQDNYKMPPDAQNGDDNSTTEVQEQ